MGQIRLSPTLFFKPEVRVVIICLRIAPTLFLRLIVSPKLSRISAFEAIIFSVMA